MATIALPIKVASSPASGTNMTSTSVMTIILNADFLALPEFTMRGRYEKTGGFKVQSCFAP